jgi:hypothetical protein
MLDIYDVMHAFPKVNYRYYVSPTQKMPSGLDIIKTDNKTITWPLQMLGRKNGADQVNKGVAQSFQELSDYVEKFVIPKRHRTSSGQNADGTMDLEFTQ